MALVKQKLHKSGGKDLSGVTQKSCINFFKKKLDSARYICNMQGHELAVKNTGTSFNRD